MPVAVLIALELSSILIKCSREQSNYTFKQMCLCIDTYIVGAFIHTAKPHGGYERLLPM